MAQILEAPNEDVLSVLRGLTLRATNGEIKAIAYACVGRDDDRSTNIGWGGEPQKDVALLAALSLLAFKIQSKVFGIFTK